MKETHHCFAEEFEQNQTIDAVLLFSSVKCQSSRRQLRDCRELEQRSRRATRSASSVVSVWQASISFLFHLHSPMHTNLHRYCKCSIAVDGRWMLDRTLLLRRRDSSWRRTLDEVSGVMRHGRMVLVEWDDCRQTRREESSTDVRTRPWAEGRRSSLVVSESMRFERRSSVTVTEPVSSLPPKQSKHRPSLHSTSYQLFLCSGQLHFLIDRLLLRDQFLSVLLGESIVPPFIDGIIVQLH